MTSAEIVQRLPTALLAAARLLPVALTSPFLAGPLVPPAVRVGLALGLGSAIAALVAPARLDGLALAAAALREGAVGLVLALAVMAPVEAARAGGRLADTLRGATLAELHVAPIRQRESAAGDLLAHWTILLASWAGADRLVLGALLRGFAALPPGATLPSGPALDVALRAAAGLLATSVAIAAPAAAGVLAADLALALVARVTPQLGASNAAQPARAALGLFALAAAASAAGGRLVAEVARAASLAGALGGTP